METVYLTPQLWQSSEVADLVAALVAFQIDFQGAGLKKDATNPHLRNQYLSLDNLLNTCRPLLSKHGLVVTQDLAGEYLITTLFHVSGQYKGSAMIFQPMTGNKGTNALQELGGGITYAKRYALGAMLAISIDADEDGNGSKLTENSFKKQSGVKVITKKPVENEGDFRKILMWANEDPRVNVQKALESYELTKEQVKSLQSLVKPA